MLERVLEPEVMDTPTDAADYDQMDHSAVNRVFAADFLSVFAPTSSPILDVGTGTAQIPLELCKQHSLIQLVAIDLAEEMLQLARENIRRANFDARITVQRENARELSFADGAFAAVISNSIIHHIPEPKSCFAEMLRVLVPGGVLFVRDLLRPDSIEELHRLVELYASGANAHQRQLFADSLHAALTVEEVRSMLVAFGLPRDCVQQTSDRHWTVSTVRPSRVQ